VDWTKHGILGPVQDQGKCGSCWAFATTAAIEAVNNMLGAWPVKLSEQQLIDCLDVNCFGCSGGFPMEALRYVSKNGGLLPAHAYPYCGLQHVGYKKIWV
jgi:hypothetical protein